MVRTGPEIEETTKKPKKSIGPILALSILVLLMGCGLYLQHISIAAQVENAYQQGLGEIDHVEYIEVPIETQVEIPVEVHIEITSEIIRDSLKDIGELVAQEYNYTEVSTFKNTQAAQLFGHSVNLPWTKASYIYSYDGIIKAGIDFTQIAIDKDDDVRKITATLPKSTIISHEFVNGSFELYDEKNNLFNPFSISDFDLSNTQLKESAEKKALEKGLLEQADANAEAMLTSFLQSGYDLHDYQIIIKWR